MRAKLRQIKQQLRKRMHDPVRQTGQWLKSVVQGHFNYYAVPGNLASLGVFRNRVLALLVAYYSPPEPEAPDQLDAYACTWLRDGFPNRVRSIPFRMLALPPLIRDKNRMR